VTFLYENALSKVSGGTNVVTVQVKPNDMYDYDSTGDAVTSSRCTMTHF